MQIPIIQNIVSALHRRYQHRVTVRELMALDQRTLKDIGLHESDIPSVVEGTLNSRNSVPPKHTNLSNQRPIVSVHGIGECLNCTA